MLSGSKKKEYAHKYYLDHKDQAYKSANKWRKNNKDKVRAAGRRRYAIRKEKDPSFQNTKYNKEAKRRYYMEHKEEVIKSSSEWAKNNPEKRKQISRDSARRINKNNPLLNRERKLKFKYGITLEQEKEMLFSQGNKCAICDREFSNTRSRRPGIDHDHKTGKVREILCHNCNLMLGHAEDSPELLKLGAQYLEKHSDNFCRQDPGRAEGTASMGCMEDNSPRQQAD